MRKILNEPTLKFPHSHGSNQSIKKAVLSVSREKIIRDVTRKELQNREAIMSKLKAEVTPKNESETESSQSFDEVTNLKEDTQNEESVLNEGYIKVYRKTIRSRVFQNEGLFKVWMWCLLRANHKGQWVSVKTGKGTTEVHILPGQFIFGRKTAAKELKMKPSTVRNRTLKLKNMRNLDIQSNSQYSIIIIINWDTYQAPLEKEGHLKRTGVGQPKDTNKNDKKEKNNIYGQNFLAFWKTYPNKAAKKKAQEAWNKLEKAEDMEVLLPILLDAAEKQQQAKENSKAKGEFTPEWPHGATWLNGKRWEDEIGIKQGYDGF